MESTKKSNAYGGWPENWSLIRKLWPEWEPTDEMIREVWFRSFDKPHGIQGPQVINHDALREAIVEHRKTNAYARPEFLSISDLYRLNKQRVIAEVFRARMTPESKKELQRTIDAEHQRRIDEVMKWPLSRIAEARAEVGRVMPGLAHKSGDVETWSATYSGLIIAADERLQNGEANEDGEGERE